MSVVDKHSSDDFEVLEFEQNQLEGAEQNVRKQEDAGKEFGQGQQSGQQELTMGVVIQQQTYLVLQTPSHHKICQNDQWKHFIFNRKKELRSRTQQMFKQEQCPKDKLSRVSMLERHTILLMNFQDVEKRKEFWSVVDFNEELERQYQEMEVFQIQNWKGRLEALEKELPKGELSALKKGVEKASKVLKNILDSNLQQKQSKLSQTWKDHLKILKKRQTQLMQWMQRMLQRCALDFQQIRYCKGLQYICIGIIFSYPVVNIAKYSQVFYHILSFCNFDQLYLEGSPRYYSELNKICGWLREEKRNLFDEIQKNEGNQENLFITYFRSCLLYRVDDPELIRKLFELMFAEGVGVIKVMILRILDFKGEGLIGNEHFLQKLASFLIYDYFQPHKNDQISIANALIKLFEA